VGMIELKFVLKLPILDRLSYLEDQAQSSAESSFETQLLSCLTILLSLDANFTGLSRADGLLSADSLSSTSGVSSKYPFYLLVANPGYYTGLTRADGLLTRYTPRFYYPTILALRGSREFEYHLRFFHYHPG
jgi:hypothetical protein